MRVYGTVLSCTLHRHCCGAILCNCGCLLFPVALLAYFIAGYALTTVVNQSVWAALLVDSAAIAKSTYLNTATTYNVYVFNITNARDVQVSGATPIVQQLGPYSYTKTSHKFNVTLSADQTQGALEFASCRLRLAFQSPHSP